MWGKSLTVFYKSRIRVFLTMVICIILTNSSLPISFAAPFDVIGVTTVGSGPIEIAFDSVHNRMYVTNYYDNTVSVIDTATNAIIGGPIGVGAKPRAIAFDPVHKMIYVANYNDNNISIIDTDTNLVIGGGPIGVGINPNGITFDSVHNRMYVATINDGSITIIDTNTRLVIATIVGFNGPYHMAFAPAYSRMYVTNNYAATVSVIDTVTNAVIGAPINVANGPRGIAFESANNRIYVAHYNGNQVRVHDAASPFAFLHNTGVAAGKHPNGIAFDPVHNRMYFTNFDAAEVQIIETEPAPAPTQTTSNGNDSRDRTPPIMGTDSNGKRLVQDGFVYNGLATDVQYYYTPYPLIHVQVGKPNVAEFKIYDNSGDSQIQHFEMDFGLKDRKDTNLSKTRIEWDRTFDGIEKTTIVDPENALQDVKVESGRVKCSDSLEQMCLSIKIYHTFRAPLDFNIVGTNMWDEHRNSIQQFFNDGIQVDGKSLNPPKEHTGIYQGKIFHLTETDKNTSVDDSGNIWSLDHDIWVFSPPFEIRKDPQWQVMTRLNSNFATMQKSESSLAESKIHLMCPLCTDKNYGEINNIHTIEINGVIPKLQDPIVVKKMNDEALRASKYFDAIYQKIHQ